MLTKIANGKLPEAILRNPFKLFFCYSFFGATKQVKLCFKDGLSVDKIQLIAQINNKKPVFTSEEMLMLRLCARVLTFEDLQIIAETHNGKAIFDVSQMQEITFAIIDGCKDDFIKTLSETHNGKPIFSSKAMWKKRAKYFE